MLNRESNPSEVGKGSLEFAVQWQQLALDQKQEAIQFRQIPRRILKMGLYLRVSKAAFRESGVVWELKHHREVVSDQAASPYLLWTEQDQQHKFLACLQSSVIDQWPILKKKSEYFLI